MALLSTLVERIAEIEGIDEAYASGVARYLREAGLLTQAGRGRGAAHMNTVDAAQFLIGLNASRTAKDAPEYTRHFSELRIVHQTNTMMPGVCEENQRFLSAMIKLIDICADAELKPKLEARQLEITIQFNRPVSYVHVGIEEITEDEFQVPATRWLARGLYGSPIPLAKKSTPDRLEITTISQRTLLVAADVIAN